MTSYYLPNIKGNGMTPAEYSAWMQWMRDMETLVTDPEKMCEIERSQKRIAERVAKRLARSALGSGGDEKKGKL